MSYLNYRAADGTVYKYYTPLSNDIKIEEINYPTKNVIHIPGKYHEHYRQWANVDEIPTNIKHKFGSRRTNELLKDELKVHDTLSQIYNTGLNRKHMEIPQPSEEAQENTNELIDNESVSTYYDLSNHLRYVISRGYPILARTSHKQDIHNWNLNKEFLADFKENVESPYRRKKDWLSIFKS